MTNEEANAVEQIAAAKDPASRLRARIRLAEQRMEIASEAGHEHEARRLRRVIEAAQEDLRALEKGGADKEMKPYNAG